MSITAHFTLDRGEFRLDAQLEIPPRGVTALFGASGCGKTTLLRCMAGLEHAEGHMEVMGEPWQTAKSTTGRGLFLPSHRRAVGYVFQDVALFPHLTVLNNLKYGLKRTPRQRRRIRLEEVTALLGLTALLGRRPDQLSGGQRQRVGIGRALLTSPRLLLMDEPMASLDLNSKAEILPYLERLHAELDIPVVYVSHAPDEVLRLADHMILLEDGRVSASGAVAEVFNRVTLPMIRSAEAATVIECRVVAYDAESGMSRVEFVDGELRLPRGDLREGSALRLRIFARDVSLSLDPPGRTTISNILPARIRKLADLPDRSQVLVHLDLGQTRLLSRVTRESVQRLALQPELPVFAQIKSVALDSAG